MSGIVDMQFHDPEPLLARPATQASDLELKKEIVLQMIDAVGVDSVIFNPLGDDRFAVELAREAPHRFALVETLNAPPSTTVASLLDDPAASDVEERVERAWNKEGVVALRLLMSRRWQPGIGQQVAEGVYDRVLRQCSRLGAVLIVLGTGNLPIVARLAAAHSDLRIMVDHFGVPQPPLSRRDSPPWGVLPDLLRLAKYDNVYVKLCGAPALSDEPYPYHDAWPRVAEVIEAFGVRRVAWASDITRFRGQVGWPPPGANYYVGKHTYMESLAFFAYNDNLSAADKDWILGRTARTLLNWSTR